MVGRGKRKVAKADKAAAKPAKAAARALSASEPACKTRPGAEQASEPVPEKGGSSLVAHAYAELKEKIIRGYFLPGQYLNEAAICALLSVGRTPVHQALQRLELDGLIEIVPRKGVIVLPDSIAEIIKILDSRLAVEPELARAAAGRATPEAAAELRALAGVTKPDPE